MRTQYRIVLARLLLFRRALARRLGYLLKRWVRRLIAFGEERECAWGVAAFLRLEQTEMEIVGNLHDSFRGPVYAAGFRCVGPKAEKRVVLSLNWIATKEDPLKRLISAPRKWIFGGRWEMIIDPARSHIHESDGMLWCMLPNSGYAVFRPRGKDSLRFAGDPDTPRVYKYY